MKVFSIYDCKAEAYLKPFFCQNRAVALRSFSDALAEPQSGFAQHPEDFTLFEIGEWDESEGKLKSHEAKVSLGCALEYVVSEPTQLREVK